MEIICFHNPDEENGYLGNWYLSEFEVNGVRQIIVYEGLKAKFSQNEECFNGLFLPKSLRVSQRYGIFKVYFCQNVQK